MLSCYYSCNVLLVLSFIYLDLIYIKVLPWITTEPAMKLNIFDDVMVVINNGGWVTSLEELIFQGSYGMESHGRKYLL